MSATQEPRMRIAVPWSYSGSVLMRLKTERLDDENIPKHILGFSVDYNLTKKRIDRFYDEKHDNGGDSAFEWQTWASMPEAEKETYVTNWKVLCDHQAELQLADPLAEPEEEVVGQNEPVEEGAVDEEDLLQNR
ncbi:MAG: hypothetical protein SGARI_006256 [Bacillariaceae sp.]